MILSTSNISSSVVVYQISLDAGLSYDPPPTDKLNTLPVFIYDSYGLSKLPADAL